MAPKKKKGKGKKMAVGSYPVEEMTAPELQQYAMKLKEELDRTMLEMENTRIDVDQLKGLLDKTIKDTEMKKTVLKSKQSELEEKKILYDKIMRERDLKMNNVTNENDRTLMDRMVLKDLEFIDHEKDNLDAKRLVRDRVDWKKKEIRTMQANYSDLQQEIWKTRCKDVGELVPFCERRIEQLFQKYEKLFNERWDAINTERVRLLRKSDESKKKWFEEVADIRDKEFRDIREYFNRTTFDCLALISDLKDELEALKKGDMKLKIELNQAKKANRNMKKLKEEVEAEKDILEHYERDKVIFAKGRADMQDLMKKIREREFENYMLSLKLESAVAEKKRIEKSFFAAAMKLQCSISLKNVYLERKVRALKVLIKKETAKISAAHHTIRRREPVGAAMGMETPAIVLKRPVPTATVAKTRANKVVHKPNIVNLNYPCVSQPFFPLKGPEV